VKQFTLEYWKDDGWFVGRLKEMPAVISQGETLWNAIKDKFEYVKLD
jgi:predicted RNase H-like HicB family nuclease